MVSSKQLMDYAYNIYIGKEGYSFEKVLELFPKYYPEIQAYYMNFVIEEERKRIINLNLIGGLALKFFKQAEDAWNELIKSKKELDKVITPFNADKYQNEILDMYRRQIKMSQSIIKAAENVKLYAGIDYNKELVEAADTTIQKHLDTIERANNLLKFFGE